MEPLGARYVAVRDILEPGTGARAYAAGDLVHESAVEGDHAWLVLGEDVKPREGAKLDMPSRNASQAAWAAYAISQGADPGEAEGNSRSALVEAYGPKLAEEPADGA